MEILDIDVWGYHNIKLMKMIISERKREYHAHITRQLGDCCSHVIGSSFKFSSCENGWNVDWTSGRA